MLVCTDGHLDLLDTISSVFLKQRIYIQAMGTRSTESYQLFVSFATGEQEVVGELSGTA